MRRYNLKYDTRRTLLLFTDTLVHDMVDWEDTSIVLQLMGLYTRE